MTLERFSRITHRWATVIVALPALLTITTGLMLQVKKQWSWVQPPERRGTGTEPRLDLPGLLGAVQGHPGLAGTAWADIDRVDLRPARGLAKVHVRDGREVQVDLGTGRVLQVAPRRSEWLESVHDGSFLGGNAGKLGLFLPSGLALLVLWATGLHLFLVRRGGASGRGRDGATAGAPEA